MSEHKRKTIVELQGHLQTLEDEAADIKRTINSLCKSMNEPPLYPNPDAKSVVATGPVRRDQYYGKALATVAREILEARQAMNLGPATVTELYEKMVEGGYQFDTSNVDNAKRVLRISLAKNTSTFHKLPGGAYGLLDWYPAIRDSKKKNGSSKAAEADGEEDAVPVAMGGSDGEGGLDIDAELPKKPR